MVKGLKNMASRIPVLRYIHEVRKGTEDQKAQAEKFRETAIPITESLRDAYAQNGFSALVDEAFRFGRP